MKLERIVVGVDFSESSIAAAQWAARYFGRGAEIVLIHAIDIPEPPPFLGDRYPPLALLLDTYRAGAETRLARLVDALAGGRTRSVVRFGRASEQIEKVAGEVGADLIIAGKHGERSSAWGGPGSTAERLSRSSGIPVLLAAGLRQAVPKRLLVAVDDDDVTDWVLGWARMFSERFGADVTALHIVSNAVLSHVLSMTALTAGNREMDEARIQGEFRQEADRWLHRIGAAGLPRERVDYRTAFGHPAEEILTAAMELDADLVIMGSRRPGKLRRAVLGSVASEVLHRAPRPVLIVHEPGS
jgi:universal stress protein E